MVMNDCISIMKDLLFYYIECNYDECVTKDLLFYYIECNDDEGLYECYERPIVVLY